MEYVYPAIFEENTDGSYKITFPDIPGCVSEGKSIGNALDMAQKALAQWLCYLLDEGEEIPEASVPASIVPPAAGFINFVSATIRDTSAVRRTVSLPKWMDEEVSKAGLSLSRVLQEALSERLQ